MFVESPQVTTVRRRRTNQCRPALECLEPRTVPAFFSPAVYEGGPYAGEAVITELNGDGIPDIVEGAHFLEPTFAGFVRVLLGNDDGTGCGTGSFTETDSFFTAKGTHKITAGDLKLPPERQRMVASSLRSCIIAGQM